ncbi:hypothetical protein L1987_42516 [Smallanthus sonchifolius]|uniref:Uncharacterized protein n=1 Tax=Smallanthus sonchifolius TaxID=185202 RepID=A0ACB9GIT8_9ASTR|nr:hypothetical protein L1987_42516 [Smallanthus sonchifolius]
MRSLQCLLVILNFVESRLLSEYLGLDNMLSLVCITYDGIKALVTYDKGGSINKSSGLYGLGTAIGQPLEGRFNVICLENMSRVAVNMIHIDDANLFYLTHDGNGLRETLFYTLFSRLQVYKTRAEMVQALPCIYDGAISLDGGMIKGNGVYSLGTSSSFRQPQSSSLLPYKCTYNTPLHLCTNLYTHSLTTNSFHSIAA